ncbi:unnamed protein product [Closterium sp. NIES-65]|nr:unnamed protein product [Closterium sp. NIES-65]
MFGGVNKRYEHESATLGCTMKFSIYFPPAATSSRVPVIYWLSGLTCTDENFIQKSFAQKYASEHGVALIVPDTSPRKLPHPPPSPHPSLCTRRPGNARKPASEHGVGLIVPDISPRKLPHPPPEAAVQAPSPSHSTFPAGPSRPQSTGSRSLSPTPRPVSCITFLLSCISLSGLKVEGESDNWDFGVGAGFYVNATVPKWKNWQMYDYVTEETLSSYVTEETLSSYVTEELHRILESTQRQSKKRINTPKPASLSGATPVLFAVFFPYAGGLKVEGESDNWDFGVGAGFYVNATVPKWKNWQMYDYVTEELHRILSAHYTNLDMQRRLSLAAFFSPSTLNAPFPLFPPCFPLLPLFSLPLQSVSAFAPICNPTECPWGQKAFTGYLGDDKAAWEEYDATALVKQYPGLPCQLYWCDFLEFSKVAPTGLPCQLGTLPLPSSSISALSSSSSSLPLHACPSQEYDATALVNQYPGPKVDILIDQGDSDKFDHEKHLLPEVGDSDKFDHEKQLLPENFQKARTEAS